MALKYVDSDEDDDVKIKTMSPSTMTCISTTMMATHYAKINKNSCHNVDWLGNGINELPDPLLVGPWVDGTSLGSADGGASRALLGVDLQTCRHHIRCSGRPSSGR